MLWLVFAMLVTPGYITYKRKTFNLEGKINAEWSRSLGTAGRLRIQNQLGCCGYFSPFVEATVSQTCYARSILPGCKKAYLDFEELILTRWYTVAFAIVPLHIGIMVAALLCSNHVTYRFGKGMMPKAYRLSMNSMAVIMDNYAKCVKLGQSNIPFESSAFFFSSFYFISPPQPPQKTVQEMSMAASIGPLAIFILRSFAVVWALRYLYLYLLVTYYALVSRPRPLLY